MRLVRAVAASVMMWLLLAGPALAGSLVDLRVVKLASPTPVVAGTNLTFLITVANGGPSTANNVSMDDTLPAGVTFVSLSGPAGWTMTTPAVGGTGTVTATIASLTEAAGDQIFTLVVAVGASVPNGTVISNTATVFGTDPDPDLDNNSSTATSDVTGAPPAASLADAAMPEPAAGNPLATLGFTALLLAMLSGVALLAVRRVRT